jgi:hypothetical protein
MSFFGASKPERRGRPPLRRERTDRPWARPALVLPNYLDSDFVVARTDEVAVVVHGVACYPTGFQFSLETVTRHTDEDGSDGPDYGDLFWSTRQSRTLPPELLRFGISYSNGATATSLDAADAMDEFEATRPSDRQDLRLYLGGGGGGDGRWSYKIWVAPLPPEGPVAFVCEWPAFGIEETQTTVDGVRFIRAAEKAKPIF